MMRLCGRVALVTGASAGIGAAIASELVVQGMKVVAVARRVDRVEALNSELKGASGKLYPLKCDVTCENEIVDTFEWIKKNLGGVDVLVNNAGINVTNSNLAHANTENWRKILDVNVLGLSICTREAIMSMQARCVDDGHIIHINSICGHSIIASPGVGMYSASKYGVTALTTALRKELLALNSRIKITSISPGVVKTDILIAAGSAANLDLYDTLPHLQSQDIADSVIYVLGTPPHVQIDELTIRPVGEVL